MFFDHSVSINPSKTQKQLLSQTIQNFKKVVTKQWESMGGTLTWTSSSESIKDPTALYLRQHLTAGGIEVVDPPEELPSGQAVSQTITRMGQAGGGDGFHHGHI